MLKSDKCFEKYGLLYEKGHDHELRMVNPAFAEIEQLHRTIMSEVHDCACSGPLGFDKTLEVVKWSGVGCTRR